jgi:hypothetical protein
MREFIDNALEAVNNECLTCEVEKQSGKCLWNMGTSDHFTFRFLKILKPHISMSQKIMALNIWKYI